MMAASALALLGSAACTSTPTQTATPPPAIGTFGIDLTTQDPTVKPGDDFNRFANGQWLDTFEIPADKSSYSVFTRLADGAEIDVRTIIEDTAAEAPPADTLEGKIAAIYNAYMDTDTIEALGLAPIEPYMDMIDAIETREDLAVAFATTGLRSPFGGWVDVDSKQTDQYIFYINHIYDYRIILQYI